MKKHLFFIFIFFSFETLSLEIHSPFFLGYSGSGIASLEEGFSYLLNPASLGFHRRSKSGVAYSIKEKQQVGVLSFTDIKTGFPLSITYERHWSSRWTKSDLDRISSSLGMAINSFLSLGMTLYRETWDKDHQKETLWNGDIGMLVRLGRKTGLAFTLNRLLIEEQQISRIASAGVYQKFLESFHTRLDVSYSQKEKWEVKGAFETLFKKFLVLRVGSSINKKKELLISGGLSFYGPRLQMDYNAQTDQNIFQHALIFKLLF